MGRLLAFLILLCTAQSALCGEQAAKQDKSSFAVEIQIDKDSLKTDFYKKVGMFFVSTKIRNITDANQKITVWTQQGWSWISDNPKIMPDTAAAKNYPTTVTLKPGQEYEGGMGIYTNDTHRPLTFRLGFLSKTDIPISSQPGMANNKNIIWSAPVMLEE